MFGYGGMPSFFGSFSPYQGGFGGGFGGFGGYGGMRQMNPYMMGGGYGNQMQSNPYARFGGMGRGFGGFGMGGMGGMGGMFGMPRFNPYMMQSFFGSMQRQPMQPSEAASPSIFQPTRQMTLGGQPQLPAGGPNRPPPPGAMAPTNLTGVELARQNDPRLRTGGRLVVD